MLSRKKHEKSYSLLPSKWIDQVKDLLSSTYDAQCGKLQRNFYVAGFTWPDEILLAVSFLDQKDQATIPITYLVSSDMEDKKINDKFINTLVDSIGHFFDSYFEDPNALIYYPRWQETTMKGNKLYYKVTRENIELTLMADKILGNDIKN